MNFSDLLKCLLSLLALSALPAASAQGMFSPLTEVCPAALNSKNYIPSLQSLVIKGQGTGGWLYGVKDFMLYHNPATYAPELKRFADTLEARGIKLVLVFIPPRSVGASAHLDLSKAAFRDVDLQAIEAAYRTTIQQVNALGIWSPNLLDIQRSEPVNTDYYHARDHHWSVHAQGKLAQAISQHLKDTGSLKGIPEVKFELMEFSQSSLDGYNSVVNLLCGRLVGSPNFQALKSVQIDGDLLGADAPEIVVLGDSNVYWDVFQEESFVAALRYDLQRDVLNAGVSGGWYSASPEKYFFSKSFRENPPKVVIWEMDGGYDLKNFLTQLRPAVAGTCKNPVQQAQGAGQITFKQPVTQGNYLVLNLPDRTRRTYTLEFTSESGQTWQNPISHESRTPYSPLYYLDVSAAFNSLKIVEPDDNGNGEVQVTECRDE